MCNCTGTSDPWTLCKADTSQTEDGLTLSWSQVYISGRVQTEPVHILFRLRKVSIFLKVSGVPSEFSFACLT